MIYQINTTQYSAPTIQSTVRQFINLRHPITLESFFIKIQG
jgi:hypothetical protein